MFDSKPIPKRDMPGEWRHGTPSDEELVSVRDYLRSRVYVEGFPKTVYLRVGVCKRLEQALWELPQDYTLKIYDAWRPTSVQQVLYDKCREEQAEFHDIVPTFVETPGTGWDAPMHNTGGAVDVTLAYRGHPNVPVPMGSRYGDYTVMSATDWYERHDVADTTEGKYAQRNRRILYGAMTVAGFTNLPRKWWHYDFGNGNWAAYTGQEAVYAGVDKALTE